jgi:DNA-3-methyladenine glycosylase I
MLLLEGAQAGLTWETILLKRDGYRRAFAKFDPKKVARFTAKNKALLLKNSGIIRNRLKIDSAVTNAQSFLTVQEEFGSFDRYVWQFVGGKPKVNRWAKMAQVPTMSSESEALSKDLKKRGFRFVGSTIIYAYLQASGLVNDHTTDCCRSAHEECGVPRCGLWSGRRPSVRPFRAFSVYRDEGEAWCLPIHSKGESHETSYLSRCAKRAPVGGVL